MPSKVKQIIRSLSELPTPTIEEVKKAHVAKVKTGILPRRPMKPVIVVDHSAEAIKKAAEQAPLYEAPKAEAPAKPKIYRDPKTGRMISQAKYAALMEEAEADDSYTDPMVKTTKSVMSETSDEDLAALGGELDQIADMVDATNIGKTFATAQHGDVKLVGIGPRPDRGVEDFDDETVIEETPVPEDDDEDISEDEASIRAVLIDQLLEYDSGEKRQMLRDIYLKMTTAQLQDQLTLLQLEWGGSAKMKATLEEVHALMKRAQENPLTKARMSLLGIKYREYHQLAQKIEKALGTDTVIHGMQHVEYHKQLKSIIKTNAVLGSAIREMADMIAFKTVGEEEDANLSPSNVEELVRVCLAIGTSAKSWMLGMSESVKRVTGLEGELKRSKDQLKAATEALGSARDMYSKREEELRKQQHARFGQKFALVDYYGSFLSIDDDAESINPKVMSFTKDMGEALLLPSEEKVRRVYDRLRSWSRLSSKYHKMVIKKGLHPDGLSVVRVTLTKV